MAGDPSLYRREPGSIRPHGGQIRAVWQWTAERRRRADHAPALEGAYRALEWAIGLSNTPPISGQRYLRGSQIVETAFTHPNESDILKPVTNHLLAREINHAADQAAADPDPDKVNYAVGAHGLLSWWAGVGELPAPLVPDPDQLRNRVPRQPAASAAA